MKTAATLLAVLVATAPLPAFGQAPAAPAVPSHSCVKPEFPGRVSPEPKIRRWQSDYRAYIDCLKAYLNERKAAIEAQTAKANSIIDQINADIAEYNETIKSLGN